MYMNVHRNSICNKGFTALDMAYMAFLLICVVSRLGQQKYVGWLDILLSIS